MTEKHALRAGAEAPATDVLAWLVKDLASRRDAMWDKTRSPATVEEQLAFARASEIDTIIAFVPLLAAQGKSGAEALASAPDPKWDGIIGQTRLLIERFRSIGGIPDLCDLAWQLCNENQRLRAEALAPPAPGWQPIETAPKDGSAFLAFGIHDHSPPDAARGVKVGDYWWAIVLWDVWRSSNIFVFAKDGKGTWSYPTHWQPLPAPPRADARDRKD